MRILHKDISEEWNNGWLILRYGDLKHRYMYYSVREAKRLFIREIKERAEKWV